MERRKDERFKINLECQLHIENGLQIINGRTTNVSRSGALIEIPITGEEAAPQIGDFLWLKMHLPTHPQFGPHCLSGKAMAVRTSREEGVLSVAVHFERIEILAMQPANELRPTAVM